MMTLSTMWNGDRRFDERGELPVAAMVLARWAHDPGSLAIVRYSSNFVFTFTDAGHRSFLRVADARERSRPFIGAEVDLLVWLAAMGSALATPLPSLAGHLAETVEIGHDTFHGVVFPGLAGDQRDISDLDLAGFSTWGAALGRLHTTMRGYAGSTIAARGSWRETMALIRAQLPPGESAIHRETDELGAALLALPVNPDTYGLIHGDFELDNLIWRQRTIGMLDFDDCTHHWYAADIAFALRDLFDVGAGIDDARVQSFMVGYTRHHAVATAMVSSLPLFSRLARLTTYARIARSIDLPAAGVPAWVIDLRRRLERKATGYLASLS